MSSVHTEIGEVVVILVNVLGWFVLATTLIVGMVNIARFLTPTIDIEEVTIEQAK